MLGAIQQMNDTFMLLMPDYNNQMELNATTKYRRISTIRLMKRNSLRSFSDTKCLPKIWQSGVNDAFISVVISVSKER
jgi:hypothetical protein